MNLDIDEEEAALLTSIARIDTRLKSSRRRAFSISGPPTGPPPSLASGGSTIIGQSGFLPPTYTVPADQIPQDRVVYEDFSPPSASNQSSVQFPSTSPRQFPSNEERRTERENIKQQDGGETGARRFTPPSNNTSRSTNVSVTRRRGRLQHVTTVEEWGGGLGDVLQSRPTRVNVASSTAAPIIPLDAESGNQNEDRRGASDEGWGGMGLGDALLSRSRSSRGGSSLVSSPAPVQSEAQMHGNVPSQPASGSAGRSRRSRTSMEEWGNVGLGEILVNRRAETTNGAATTTSNTRASSTGTQNAVYNTNSAPYEDRPLEPATGPPLVPHSVIPWEILERELSEGLQISNANIFLQSDDNGDDKQGTTKQSLDFNKVLESFVYRSKSISATHEGCAICLDNFKERERLTKLGCNHYFHKHCIVEWLQKNPQCPFCRFDVS